MKKIYILITLAFFAGIAFDPLYAMNAASPSREDIIELTLSNLNQIGQPTELAPIRIKVRDSFKENEFIIARALYLYNQRRLTDARGDLKEVLMFEPRNKTAAEYLGEANAKIEAVEKPRAVLEEEIKGIASVDKSKQGGIYGREEFGNTDGKEKFTTNTAVAVAKVNKQTSRDWTDTFVAEALKLEGTMGDYKYTATANINYFNKDSNRREDIRLRNIAWWMKNDKVQLTLGDASSYLSRYVLNGVNYRGANLKMDVYENTFGDIKNNMTFLFGKIPYYWLTQDKYIYPREIAAVRNELDLWERWDLNASFAYLWDSSSRVQKIDTNNKAKENGLIGIDQTIRVLPGIWTLYSENAFSYGDDDRESDDKILKGSAQYYVSDLKTREFKMYNSYERIDPDFRSFVGLTGYTANKQVTIDREHILNFIEYEPYEFLDLGLQYSRTRTNLAKAYDTQTIKDQNYKANIKLTPENELPRFSLRGSIWTTNCGPGPIYAPAAESNWDSFFEIAKTLWEADLSAAFGMRGYSQFVNDNLTYEDALEYTFTLSANKKYFDRIDITPSYTLSRIGLKKTPSIPIYSREIVSQLFDLSLAAGLWDTATLTFDYNFSNTEDFATPSVWGVNNAFTTTFSWPFTTMLGFRKKLVFSPFLSYHYSTGRANFYDRDYFATRLEGDYFLTENSKFNLSGEYRSNSSNDHTYAGFGDEYRIIVSYKTVNGF